MGKGTCPCRMVLFVNGGAILPAPRPCLPTSRAACSGGAGWGRQAAGACPITPHIGNLLPFRPGHVYAEVVPTSMKPMLACALALWPQAQSQPVSAPRFQDYSVLAENWRGKPAPT